MELSTITIEGSHADQGGDPLPVQSPQFGQVHEQTGDGHRSDVGHGFQEGGFRARLRLALDEFAQRYFQLTESFVELFNQVTHVLANQLGGDRLRAISLGRAELDELVAASRPFAQFGSAFPLRFPEPPLGLLAEASDDAGVQPIGLGQTVQAAGKVADSTGIRHRHAMTGRRRLADHGALETAGGFDHNQATAWRKQLVDVLPESGWAVRQGETTVRARQASIEHKLGNIDTGEGVGMSAPEHFPDLQMRAHPSSMGTTALAAVRVQFAGPATIVFCDGAIGTRTRSICRRLLGGRLLATLRNLHQQTASIENACKHTRPEDSPVPVSEKLSRTADLSGKIGTSLPRFARHDAELAGRKFVDVMSVPSMFYNTVRLSDRAHAKVRRIDASRALAGVHRVVTATHVLGERYIVLIEIDWPVFLAIGAETRCTGDIVATVVADTQRLARKAAQIVDIEYELLEPVTDPRKALEPGAPLVNLNRGPSFLGKPSLKRGDIEKGFRRAAHIIEDTYCPQRMEHLFLEPEACIAIPGMQDAGGSAPVLFQPPAFLFIYTQGQGFFDAPRQITSVLSVKRERVQIELVSNGVVFGGKASMSIQVQTALIARLVGQPVKVMLTRPKSFPIRPKRYSIDLTYGNWSPANGAVHRGRAIQVRQHRAELTSNAPVVRGSKTRETKCP